jgi:hypothetical protein
VDHRGAMHAQGFIRQRQLLEGFMKNIFILLIVLISLIMAVPASAQNVSTGISIADGELRSFYLAIGDYYRVPESRVVDVKNK